MTLITTIVGVVWLVIVHICFGILTLIIIRSLYKKSPITLSDILTFVLAGVLGTVAMVIWVVMKKLDKIIIFNKSQK